MSAFALLIPPACLTTHLHRLTERSSTVCFSPKRVHTRSFGTWFEPRYIFRAGRLDQ
ncbi:uncharacterized protein METZ01_LOCUS121961 [marine metagenome]|uniref:Uncharacterized protein n=1 Tax=marine metagenome TaxID=408172 RepID=A0A381XY63_9ZZZZ